jgi:hypothetical protein
VKNRQLLWKQHIIVVRVEQDAGLKQNSRLRYRFSVIEDSMRLRLVPFSNRDMREHE